MIVLGHKRRAVKLRGEQPLGHIERLVVENFKSYQGRHEIGPFDKFTCIIGPNGSGKSNVMDAISFCLGIRAKHLRGDRLKDLVYRREEEGIESNTRSASVSLVFRTPDRQLLVYGRTINVRGQGAYLHGPPGQLKPVGYDEFVASLAKQQIFVKARNFLVFQGDVMELARRQGMDLTGVLETISGSDQFKEDYDRLSRELEVTQERARMHFQHRREIEGAVTMLGKQRWEVERYSELRNRRQQLIIEAILLKLYIAEREMERCHEACEEMRAAAGRSEADLRAARRETEEVENRRKRTETAADEATSQHFVLSSNFEQLKPEIINCRKQASHWSAKLREVEALIKEEERRHQAWDVTAKAAREDRLKAEQDIERLKSMDVPSAIELTSAQRKEYDQAVAHADAENSKARENLRESDEQLRTFKRELIANKRELKDLEDQRASGIARLGEIVHEKSSVELELANETSNLQERRKRVSQVAQEAQKYSLFRDSLLEEQRSLRFKLDAAKARREKLEQLEVTQRIADELRDAFPNGVLGRISELVLPTQKRFDLPLQMSLGGMAEAFIVTDAATGRDCVQYLKTKQISTETFLPLDRMVEPNVGPLHIITQGREARRLATMCVQQNERFLERHPHWKARGPAHIDVALKFLLSGTIIVDDLEEAKATAYVDAKRRGLGPRVVTLHGEVITPNGNMMVQSISTSGRVEFGGAEQLHEVRTQEQKLLQVEHDLGSLQEELKHTQRLEADLRDQTRQLNERHKSCTTRLQGLVTAEASEQAGIEDKARRIEVLKNTVAQGEEVVQALELKKSSLETELLRTGKKHFARLNRSLGVDDIREILQKEQKERRQLRETMEEYEELVRTLLNQEKSVAQKVKNSSKLEAMRRDCEQYRRDIETTQQRQRDLEQRSSGLAERCEVARARMKEVVAEKEKLEQEVKEKKVELARARAKLDEVRKRLKAHTDKVRVLLTIKCEVFRECDERQIQVPLERGNGKALEAMCSRERDLDTVPFEELDRVCLAIKVDFSALPDERKAAAANSRVYDSKEMEAEYDEQIAAVTAEMGGLNPNMKAVEQHEVEEGRLNEIRQLETATSTEGQRLSREFELVKAERVSRFMECFKHVESCVHPFYRELTSYDGCQGGSAYLDLDDAEEPYNGGITFTACPPGKRFFPMELLSGGERSMASMALLFAMHSYKPPPFMILDEVDAPFDRKNTNSLVNYLKKLRFQCLVISLKDSFFSHSDSIVGIYKDKEIQSSGNVSLPLKRLGEESAETPETERPIAEGGGETVDVD